MNNIKRHIIYLFLLVVPYTLWAQSINAPILQFNDICASSSFNSYNASADFVGFPAGTTFTLEMSDQTGSFSTPTPINIIESKTVGSTIQFNFSIPTSTGGKLYSLRVKSTNYSTQIISNPSNDFNAYYWLFNNRIKILDNGSGALAICGTSGKLSIDATPPSSLEFKNLKYVWKKNGVVLPGETKEELTVTTPGTYKVEVDYGKCNAVVGFLAYSQDVVVTFTSNTVPYTITSSLGNSICPSTPTTLSTTPGQSYQWYMNGQPISGATSYQYVASQAGTYKVIIGPGSACQSTSNEIVLTTPTIDATINVKTIDKGTNYIKENETLIITATTINVTSPTYAWYEPNSATPISTASSYTISQPKDGIYRLVVKENTGCVIEKELTFKVKIGIASIKIPNLISPNDQNGENDFWILPDEYKSENIEVTILDSFGKEVLKTKNYDNTWPKEPITVQMINPIYFYIIKKEGTVLKQGSITVLK